MFFATLQHWHKGSHNGTQRTNVVQGHFLYSNKTPPTLMSGTNMNGQVFKVENKKKTTSASLVCLKTFLWKNHSLLELGALPNLSNKSKWLTFYSVWSQNSQEIKLCHFLLSCPCMLYAEYLMGRAFNMSMTANCTQVFIERLRYFKLNCVNAWMHSGFDFDLCWKYLKWKQSSSS